MKTIILVDQIYKEVYGKDLAEEVDYKQAIEVGKRRIPLGQLANFYRDLEAQYGSLGQAMASKESLHLIRGGR